MTQAKRTYAVPVIFLLVLLFLCYWAGGQATARAVKDSCVDTGEVTLRVEGKPVVIDCFVIPEGYPDD